MDKVIAGLEGVFKIIDDILIYAPSLSIMKKRNRAFLDHCRLHGVTLKRTKSERAVTEVDFGGFRLSKTGIQTSPGLLESIMAFPRARKLTDLCLWISQPAKSSLTSTPVLTYVTVNRPTFLATDVSRLKGLGFVLLQMVNNVW